MGIARTVAESVGLEDSEDFARSVLGSHASVAESVKQILLLRW